MAHHLSMVESVPNGVLGREEATQECCLLALLIRYKLKYPTFQERRCESELCVYQGCPWNPCILFYHVQCTLCSSIIINVCFPSPQRLLIAGRKCHFKELKLWRAGPLLRATIAWGWFLFSLIHSNTTGQLGWLHLPMSRLAWGFGGFGFWKEHLWIFDNENVNIVLKKNLRSMLLYYLKAERIPSFCDFKPHRIFKEILRI